jgi:hypothetical protein
VYTIYICKLIQAECHVAATIIGLVRMAYDIYAMVRETPSATAAAEATTAAAEATTAAAEATTAAAEATTAAAEATTAAAEAAEAAEAAPCQCTLCCRW